MGYREEFRPADRNPDGNVKAQSARRCILVIGPTTALFQGLVYALRSRFRAYDVLLAEGCGPLSNRTNVSLVLTYIADSAETDTATRSQRHFPDAAAGLITGPSVDTLADGHRFDWANGILPLTLELDVWLAAVTVLLSGGSYHPSARRSAPPPSVISAPGLEIPEKLRGGLTRREQQVLGLLSQGLQNKLIADRLKLSEHTVKVHVHNLIRKLHVHNRTQAAALFRAPAPIFSDEGFKQ
ncbi:regulatory protein, luxR family [Devosia sp. YR412]|uniref:LuxR C-terminal-related transcriptional regulator n=1 Tax=Devosia sp. YR412 TaxID=1881030 RepID=UPI0008B9FE5B|nr:LuxR C-terminal-related transcriptional regulator [Devosia sp. YR412]SEQ37629.1 regulatory protein, luxR family [Devosia sp. YR412]